MLSQRLRHWPCIVPIIEQVLPAYRLRRTSKSPEVSPRLRSWANIVEMLYKCFVFAGLCITPQTNQLVMIGEISAWF